MTIEEKAKAYDEALERARKLKENPMEVFYEYTPKEGDTICDYIFPELKESDDERIRKAIHIYLDWLDSRNKDYQPKGDYSIKDMIAWLEKQGEKDRFIKEEIECIKGYRENAIKKLEELEKQGEKPQGKSALEAINEEKVDNQNCVKPADKVEPRFKVGDWIVDKSGLAQQVLDFRAGIYTCTYNSFTIDCESNYHLWTIKDAKDGDVLALKNDTTHTIICMSPTTCDTGSYCRLRNGFFIKNKEYGWASALLTPATKEQRDLLFQKMHEAGCLWDSESRQLLSLKAEPSGEQKPAWSEEDELKIKEIEEAYTNYCHGYTQDTILDWLKSLKQRIGG